MSWKRLSFVLCLALALLGLWLWLWRQGPAEQVSRQPADGAAFAGGGSGRSEASGGRTPLPDDDPALPFRSSEQRFAQALVSGQVTDDELQPVVGARVTFSWDWRDRPERISPPLAATETDENGHYELALPIWNGWVLVASEGYLPVRRHVEVEEPTRVLRDFILPKLSATLGGRVVEALTGEPVAGIEVTARTHGRRGIGLRGTVGGPGAAQRSGDFGFAALLAVKTDGDGVFALDLPAGGYSVKTRSEGHVEDVAYGTIAEGENRELLLKVFSVETMTLSVRDTGGRAVPDATVTRSDGLTAYTDDAGLARFPLTPSTHHERVLRVRAAGYLQTELRVPSERTSARVRLRPGPEITGVVLDDSGNPVAGAVLQPRGTDWTRSTVEPTVRSDDGGHFRFHLGTPPLQALEVRQQGFIPKKFEPDEDAPQGPFTIVLERARSMLTGRVRDGAGRPLRHFEVQLRHPTNRGVVFQSDEFHDLEGRFRMEVAPGVYRVIAFNRSPREYDWHSEEQLVTIPDQAFEEVELGEFLSPTTPRPGN